MPAGREQERRTFFLCALGHSVFLKRREAIDGYGVSLPLAAVLLVCIRADKKASARCFSYIFTDCVGREKGKPASHYSLWHHSLYACQGIGSERVLHFSLLLFHRFIFKGLVKGDKEVPMTLTLNGGVYSMHVRRSGARAHRWFFFAPIVVPSSISGDRGVPLSVSLFTRRRHF